MSSASSRQVLLMVCCLTAMTAAGCADLELPSWVPFQGPASDQVPGVVSPRERIEQLKQLSNAAGSATPDERNRISMQLATSIRTEKDPLIRLEIIRTMGRYPGPAADAVLKAALSDADTHVRMTACDAWARRGDAQAVVLLSETLRSDVDPDVRMAAARALGETKNPAAVPALGEALADTDPAMQYRAVLALKQATGKDLGNNVERWQQYVKGEHIDQPTPSLGERLGSLF